MTAAADRAARRVEGSQPVAAILGQLLDTAELDSGSVVRFDPDSEECRVEAVAGLTFLRVHSRVPVGMSSSFCTAQKGKPLFAVGASALARLDRPLDRLARAIGLASVCTVPIFSEASVVGAVTLGSQEADQGEAEIVAAVARSAEALAAALAAGGDPTLTRALIGCDDPLVAEGLARVCANALGTNHLFLCRSIAEIRDEIASPADLVLTDVYLKGEGIGAQMALLAEAGLTARVLVVASNDTQANRVAAVEAGVDGYCARHGSRGSLVEAMRAVVGGRTVPPELDRRAPQLGRLTDREGEVLLLLERGLQAKEVAAELGIAPATVKWHVRGIFAKLDAHSITGALHTARESGLLKSLEVTSADLGRGRNSAR